MSNDFDKTRQRWVMIFKWGLGIVGAALVAPVIFMAIGGILGLIVAGVVSFTAIQLAPVFSFKLANWRMKLLMEEAEKNPIQTLNNLLIEKTQELNVASEAIKQFDQSILDFGSKVDTFKVEYPDDALMYEGILQRMKEVLEAMKNAHRAAKNEVQGLGTQIQRATAIYDMALAAQKVTTLSGTAEKQVFADIKQRIAFDSVQSQLNGAFASLNHALEERSDAQLSVLTSRTTEKVLAHQNAS